MTIKEILAPVLEIPVERCSYRGDAAQYAIYRVIGQTGQLCAEDKEAETGVLIAIDLYCKGNYLATLALMRETLWLHGIGSEVEMETYEEDAGFYHVSVICGRVGEYG